MNTIFKWALQETDVQTINVPEGTTFLHVGEQNGVLCLWGMTNMSGGTIPRTIAVVGTGNWAPTIDEATYIGTVQMSSGLVWHVFDQKPEAPPE